ncbi:hypothetical protein HW555_012482 [Spodoptera exigua]|uniref:Uncharacterized protein n=1 Tax=Spodoptera exigua TaxID=7107 RepID=A0A835G705_SPOEX|nr:hypothetical protein HW555_012482 [Spodoptera exigua]
MASCSEFCSSNLASGSLQWPCGASLCTEWGLPGAPRRINFPVSCRACATCDIMFSSRCGARAGEVRRLRYAAPRRLLHPNSNIMLHRAGTEMTDIRIVVFLIDLAILAVTKVDDITKSAAPAYSPLTPLATRKETEKNNSPIPPMSPSTLELFETLSQDFSTVDHAYMDLKEDGDYDDDTESDYVPDSGEETDSSYSSVKQKRRKSVEIPESDSSENETATEGLIQTHVAMVHDNQSKTDRTTQMRHDDENHFIVTNAVYDDITVGDLISIRQSSDTEVQPDSEVAHPITENNLRAAPNVDAKENIQNIKKGRKYMNLPYHVKDKLVKNTSKSKVFCDHTCTCKQRCHLLVPTETRQQEFDRFITLGSYEAQLRERNNGAQYLKLGMTIQKIYDIYLAEFKKVYGSEKKFVSFARGKAIPQAKLEYLRSMYSLIPEDCHAFYDSLKGNSCISEYVDGYGPSLDFDLEEDS